MKNKCILGIIATFSLCLFSTNNGYAEVVDANDTIEIEEEVVSQEEDSFFETEDAGTIEEATEEDTKLLTNDEEPAQTGEFGVFKYEYSDDWTVLTISPLEDVTEPIEMTAENIYGESVPSIICANNYPWYCQKSPYVEKVVISEGISSVPRCAFYYRSNVYTSGFKKYGAYSALKEVVLPSTVTKIENTAFSGCKALEKINLENVITIGGSAIRKTGPLKGVELNKVENLGESAFEESGITSLVINVPENDLTFESAYTFSSCASLETVSITCKSFTFGAQSFSYCSALESVYFDVDSFNLSNITFQGCTSLARFSYSGTMKSIGQAAFSNCTSLTGLKLNGTETLDARAFENASALAHVCYSGTEEEWAALTESVAFSTTPEVHYQNTHYFQDGTKGTVIDPTCTKEGSHTMICDACGEAITTAIESTGHNWGDWTTISKAELLKKEVQQRTCSNCKETEEKSVGSTLKMSCKAANVSSGIQITWDKVSGAKGYYVSRKTSGGSYQQIAEITSGSKVKYVDKTAKAGKTYSYTVRAYSKSETSGVKDKTIVRLKTPSVSLKTTSKRVNISWKKITGAKGYYVYRKTSSGKYKKIATVKGVSKIKYVDKTAKSGKKYSYKVCAYSGKSTSYMKAKSIKVK